MLVTTSRVFVSMLRCESWCDDASKASAKTIDLCNNPMTKEPKLESAKRIVSEWVDLDGEVTVTTATVYDALTQNSERPVMSSERADAESISYVKDEL